MPVEADSILGPLEPTRKAIERARRGVFGAMVVDTPGTSRVDADLIQV
jgi:hypothetical protein